MCVYCQGKHNVASLYSAGELINAFPSIDTSRSPSKIRKTVRRGRDASSTNYCCAPDTLAVGELCVSASNTLCFNV